MPDHENDITVHGYPRRRPTHTTLTDGPMCWATKAWEVSRGATLNLICVKPAGHDGMHGADPFVEYGTEWPQGGTTEDREP